MQPQNTKEKRQQDSSHENQRRHPTRPQQLIGRPRLPLQNPTWPTILPDLSQPHPPSVFALHFLAALLELTLKFLLVVRRRCWAFLASWVMHCASSWRAGSGAHILHRTRVRTGPPFGWVSRMFHISRKRPTSSAEVSFLRNSEPCIPSAVL